MANDIDKNLDILMISETKLDVPFLVQQLFIEGFSLPYRLDRNSYGGGILVDVRKDITSKVIPMIENSIECVFLEINLRKNKWLCAFLIIHLKILFLFI